MCEACPEMVNHNEERRYLVIITHTGKRWGGDTYTSVNSHIITTTGHSGDAVEECLRTQSVGALADGVDIEAHLLGTPTTEYWARYDRPPFDERRATGAKLVVGRK